MNEYRRAPDFSEQNNKYEATEAGLDALAEQLGFMQTIELKAIAAQIQIHGPTPELMRGWLQVAEFVADQQKEGPSAMRIQIGMRISQLKLIVHTGKQQDIDEAVVDIALYADNLGLPEVVNQLQRYL
jgi:hypothetical protein